MLVVSNITMTELLNLVGLQILQGLHIGLRLRLMHSDIRLMCVMVVFIMISLTNSIDLLVYSHTEYFVVN